MKLKALLPALALTACASQQAAQSPDEAHQRLQPSADAAQLAPGAPWLWNDGDPVPAGLHAQRWLLDQFAARQPKARARAWAKLSAALHHEFPGGVNVYRTRYLYVIEGRAWWGVGGFVSTAAR